MEWLAKERQRVEAAVAERERQSATLVQLSQAAERLRHSVRLAAAEFDRVRYRLIAASAGAIYPPPRSTREPGS